MGAEVDRGSVEVTLRGGGKATEDVTYLGGRRDEDVSKVHKNYCVLWLTKPDFVFLAAWVHR